MAYPIQRALLSVSDKTGIVDFAKALVKQRIEILSTGGTAATLKQHGVCVQEIATYTGFPEMMGGRLKTLHPKVHGGLLGRRDRDLAIMKKHDIKPIDLLVVNLYPFEKQIASPDCTLSKAIEHIDIGGPAMLRSAAKNYLDVTVVMDSDDYAKIIADLIKNNGTPSDTLRYQLAAKVFAYSAQYDQAIADYLVDQTDRLPEVLTLRYRRQQTMRYGENPHQSAAFYIQQPPVAEPSVANAKQLGGKALSYNNIADTDAALECVKQFEEPACVIVKHANPCGVASASDLAQAYDRAYATDPESAFGGVIALNRPLDQATATAIIERQFVEVIIAPGASASAKATIKTKANVRLLSCELWGKEPLPRMEHKPVNGGVLLQDADLALSDQWQVVSQQQPSSSQLRDLLFSWKVVKFVKSNAIVYVKDQQTLGIGAGQMSRVNAVRIAVMKAEAAGLSVQSAVLASDAFFPFRDSVDDGAKVGASAIIQPGGSKRDQEVIAAANEHNLVMVFTGMRHFRH